MSPVRGRRSTGAAMTAMPQRPRHDALARGPQRIRAPPGGLSRYGSRSINLQNNEGVTHGQVPSSRPYSCRVVVCLSLCFPAHGRRDEWRHDEGWQDDDDDGREGRGADGPRYDHVGWHQGDERRHGEDERRERNAHEGWPDDNDGREDDGGRQGHGDDEEVEACVQVEG